VSLLSRIFGFRAKATPTSFVPTFEQIKPVEVGKAFKEPLAEFEPVEWSHPEEGVESSNISSVAYDEPRKLLKITFHTGKGYQYYGVPLTTYLGLMSASSKGSWFYYNIRSDYRWSGPV
jgi:hypothetical protein